MHLLIHTHMYTSVCILNTGIALGCHIARVVSTESMLQDQIKFTRNHVASFSFVPLAKDIIWDNIQISLY